MNSLVFPKFYEMHPELNYNRNHAVNFMNNDEGLKIAADKVVKSREELGLNSTVGDLQSIIISVEDDRLEAAANELLNSTGYEIYQCYRSSDSRNIVLRSNESADIIIKSRLQNNNQFKDYNINPKSMHLPNTRLETFVFECFDIYKYVEVQKRRGVSFATNEIIDNANYLFIQTIPSSFTGNSIGLIQWKNSERNYITLQDEVMKIENDKINKIYLKNIGKLDHTATRVKALNRDSALIEFMELTNYDFDFAIYVDSLNSITNVARLNNGKFAMVFTSGIQPYIDEEKSGPTEKFIYNYGVRVHHLAFETDDIDYTYRSLEHDDYKFMTEVVGSEGKGIKQAFSKPSVNTLLVNEYVCRYGGFTGFFIEENVTKLTKATENQ